MTDEEREALRQEREERKEAKRKAEQKAKELLRESLDEEQRDQFDDTKWFFVIGQSGTRYRVRHGWAGNIDELNEKDEVVARYCIHPNMHGVPIEDSMLIQKLMLEVDEPRFKEIANRSPVRVPQPIAV